MSAIPTGHLAPSSGSVGWPGVVEAFRPELPLPEGARAVTLREGNTPLVAAEVLGEGTDLNLKLESLNPTGSFKDRGMTVAVTGAIAKGARALICASTGNTAASAAAYAARAGVPCAVLLPAGNVALGKLAQARVAGAVPVAVEGSFDTALGLVRHWVGEHPEAALVNSVNPLRLEGQKTAAFEVVSQLGDAPDALVLPVGNAGNISAYYRGFVRAVERGWATHVPRLYGIQAQGAAPMVFGHEVEEPETVATAIRIGRPVSAGLARTAAAESGGGFLAVSDEEILAAHRDLPRKTGVFVEPASAASLAGFRRLRETGQIRPGERVVLVLTGNGLKDVDTALRSVLEPIRAVAADPAALNRLLGEVLW